MAGNVLKQRVIRSLPSFPIDGTIVLVESNVNEILQALETLVLERATERIRVKIETASENLIVRADKTRIGNAVLSFVQNSIEAMPNGGLLTLRAGLATPQESPPYETGHCLYGACALISIADSGTGMDRTTLKSMFEPYFTTKHGGHKGLGLPVAYSIIRKHDGCVKVASAPGRGTTIQIFLPLSKTVTHEENNALIPRSFFGEIYSQYRRC